MLTRPSQIESEWTRARQSTDICKNSNLLFQSFAEMVALQFNHFADSEQFLFIRVIDGLSFLRLWELYSFALVLLGRVLLREVSLNHLGLWVFSFLLWLHFLFLVINLGPWDQIFNFLIMALVKS